MIQADHPLTITRRCELLEVARSTVYYHPTGISAEDLALMRLLDVYRPRVLGQWFDGIRFYAAASSPTRSRRT